MGKRLNTKEYREWRFKVLEIGRRKCFECGSNKKLHCHHIKEWHSYPELRFDVSNGMILCKPCHTNMIKYSPLKNRKPEKIKLPKKVRVKNMLLKREKAAIKREKYFSCALRYSKKPYYPSKSINTLPK